MTDVPKGIEGMNINNVHGINNDTYNVMASGVKSLNLQLRQQPIPLKLCSDVSTRGNTVTKVLTCL